MRFPRAVFALPALIAAIVSSAGRLADADDDVRLIVELATEEGFPGLDSQQWLKVFTDLGITDVQIRQARAGDKPEVIDEGPGVRRVKGVLTARGNLVLPGGRFGLRDGSKLGGLLDRLRRGEDRAGAAPVEVPFGLAADSYIAVREDLRRPVEFSTAGMASADAVQRIAETLQTPVLMETGAEEALAECDPVLDEMRGLAAGTALAAVLRPAGLGLAPVATQRGLRLQIVDAREADDRWPIGLRAQDKGKALPDLLEFLNVEVENRPVIDVIQAIGGRLKTPMLLDHNALAYHELDVKRLRVSLPAARTTYGLALHKALVKAGLVEELRTDDAGQPFFWITTRAPVP
jgi:hypothetical protein